MSLNKITGILQLVATLIVILYLFNLPIPKSFAMIAVLFFIIKGVSFTVLKQNPISAIDAIAGFYLLFPVLGWFANTILNVIFIIFLLQKGVSYLLR